VAEIEGEKVEKYHFLKSSYRFTRMRTRGAIPPPFAVIQVVTALVNREYQAFLDDLRSEVILVGSQVGKSIAGTMDAEPYGDLTEVFLELMRERLGKRVKGDVVDEKTVAMIKKEMLNAQTEFFNEFERDADGETLSMVAASFSRDETFKDRLDTVREGYLNTAVERIGEGKSNLRKQFIEIFGGWIQGDRPDLEGFDDVMDKVKAEAGSFSRFFSRDQFSRLNRALTIATYEGSGAQWVQWVTVGDGRVRKTHRLLRNKIFRIDDLSKEYLDYLCRCGLIPVFDLKGRTVTKGDGISMMAA